MDATPLAARPVRHANAWALLVFTLMALLVAALFSALGHQSSTLYPEQPAVVAQAAPVVHDVASDEQQRMAALVGEGVGYTAQQAEALTTAADLVCEGITAEVPMVDMSTFLVADYGLTDDEARTFVANAATTHCR